MKCIVCSRPVKRTKYYGIKSGMKVGYCMEHHDDCTECDSFVCE